MRSAHVKAVYLKSGDETLSSCSCREVLIQLPYIYFLPKPNMKLIPTDFFSCSLYISIKFFHRVGNDIFFIFNRFS